MKPLVDADVLRYEIGFSSEFVHEDGTIIPREWDFVAELLQLKLDRICEEAGATEAPTLYITKDSTTARVQTRGKSEEYIRNFREAIAVSRPYKGSRKASKPFHYTNITAHMIGAYDTQVAEGLEADDLMAIEQTANPHPTIICSRDKDLRQVEGWQYSWECGRQPSFGPVEASKDGKLKMKGDKVYGTGSSFFHYQLLVGDSVDNIPGAKGWGPKKTYNLLQEIKSPSDQFREVRDIYNSLYGEQSDDYLREQAQLLWLVRSLDGEGKPVMWEIEEYEESLEN